MARSASAIELSLQGGGRLLLGPSAMIELQGKGQVKLYRGDVELKPAKGRPLQLTGPGAFAKKLVQRALFRAGPEKVTQLGEDPRWLLGYRSSMSDEAMGSLLAKVDGRDLPLAVGYHRVDVVIRDQIAQTTVEQSFVNSSKEQLEGVFYFPLPADASVSGFSVWIAGERVDADIVERARARQIYEDLLRRKKDPGLLEWSGGNLFKARIFPIEPSSEKRIRIRYTQVLPLEGQSYRYRYALRSELLQARPLRELALKVSVESAMPMRAISSPSHQLRVRQGEHLATAEFEAEEYSPDRDFELRIDLAAKQGIRGITHRRGDEGYFMLLLEAPEESRGGWKRELLPEGEPLRLHIYLDSSASMEAASRRTTQLKFVRALLGQLGPKDRFRLAASDVKVRGFCAEPIAATQENVRKALEWLEDSYPLGWQDLDALLDDVIAKTKSKEHVVYIGDGIGTTGSADAAANALRIAGKADQVQAIFHAVADSSSYEKLVLAAMAKLGGGSLRRAKGDEVASARDLLSEMARPPLKDLQLRFEGIRTASVHPEPLPHLAAGRQQLVLGRYLPGKAEAKGRILVTGTRNGEKLQFSTELTLPAADAGNSFLPRFWARRRIEYLLSQGASEPVRAEIIDLSARFGIMTPYTSFLVLASDEERERYGLKRRVAMRDGEEFFTQARDKVGLEALREQMRLSQGWRQNLYSAFRGQLKKLGRDLLSPEIMPPLARPPRLDRGQVPAPALALRVMDSEFETGSLGSVLPESRLKSGGRAGGRGIDRGVNLAKSYQRVESEETDAVAAAKPVGAPSIPSPQPSQLALPATAFAPRTGGRGRRSIGQGVSVFTADKRFGPELAAKDLLFLGHQGLPFPVPSLAKAAKRAPEVLRPRWDARILQVLRSLDRRPKLRDPKQGLRLQLSAGAVHAGARAKGKAKDLSWRILAHFHGASFFVESQRAPAEIHWAWLDRGRRGIANALGFGRSRAASEEDARFVPFQLVDGSLSDLLRLFREWKLELIEEKGAVLTLRFVAPAPGLESQIWRIDTERKVVLRRDVFVSERKIRHYEMHEFHQVAGLWWPGRIERFDGEGRRVQQFLLAVSAPAAPEFWSRIQQRIDAITGKSIMLPAANAKWLEARQRILGGKARLADHFALLLHAVRSQRWDESWKQFEAFAELAGRDKKALAWMRLILLQASRRGLDFAKAYQQLLARTLAKGEGAIAQAELLWSLAEKGLAPAQQLRVAKALRPVYAGAAEGFRRTLVLAAERRVLDLLRSLRRDDEAERILSSLAASYPEELWVHRQRLALYFELGRVESAMRLAKDLLARSWAPAERDAIWRSYTDALFARRLSKELEAALASWVAEKPQGRSAYLRWGSLRLFLDQAAETDQWILESLQQGLPEKAAAEDEARLMAAVQLALGRGWNWRGRRIELSLREPLAKLALAMSRRDRTRYDYTGSILNHRLFQRTEQYAPTRAALLAQLREKGAVAKLPLLQLERFISWIDWRGAALADAAFEELAAGLRARFLAAKVDSERVRVGSFLLRILDVRGRGQEACDFLRAQVQGAEGRYQARLAAQLASRLARQNWSSELEEELCSLVALTLSSEGSAEAQALRAAKRARWLGKQLERLRLAHEMGEAKDYEKLPRAELAKHRKEAERRMQQGLAERLAKEAANRQAPYSDWLRLEQLGYAAQAGQDIAQLSAAAKEFLLSLPEPKDAESAAAPRLLRERLATVLAALALRRQAPSEFADELLRLLRRFDAEQPKAADWKLQVFRLLVVLDRVDELEKQLGQYIKADKLAPRWRLALGMLRAERGKLSDAAQLFEELARSDALRQKDYQVLSQWYLVLKEDAKRHQSLERRFQRMDEDELGSMLLNESYRLRPEAPGLSSSLRPELLLATKLLFEKSSRPQQHLWKLQRLYRQTKDFRVLAPAIGGLRGLAPGAAYALLQRLQQMIDQVHEEATLDPLRQELSQRIAAAKNATDRRALRLLECVVLARAAKVLDQRQQYEEAAIAAMRAAWPGEYVEGEKLALARMLAGMGKLPPRVDRERVRAMKLLRSGFDGDPFDALQVAGCLARVQNSQGATAKAIETLRAALGVYALPQDGRFDRRSSTYVDQLMGWMQKLGRYRAAERLVQLQLELQQNADERIAWNERLYAVGMEALRNGAAMELGQGEKLYLALAERMRQQIFAVPQRLQQSLQLYQRLLEIGHKDASLRRASSDAVRFGEERFDSVLGLAFQGGVRLVANYAECLEQVAGPEATIEFCVKRIERQPQWYERLGYSFASRLAHSLGRLRHQAKRLDARLSERMLRVVLEALEKDLLHGGRRMGVLYWSSQRYWWGEKRAEFAKVAGRVHEEHMDSPAIAQRVASYYWEGLRQQQSAVDVLRGLDHRGQLGSRGQWQLVGWLQKLGEWGESLGFVEELLKQDAFNLRYRACKVTALFRTGKRKAASAFLDESVALFKKQQRWGEQQIAFFAERCHDAELWERAAKLCKELIGLRQRTRPHRGLGSGALSKYYLWLANSYRNLRHYDGAVDAAFAAIAACGPNRSRRTRALRALRRVLASLPDLDAFVAKRDALAKNSEEDSPLLRKELGRIYLARQFSKEAIAQLELALTLQSQDKESWELLVKACEKRGELTEIIDVALRRILACPWDLAGYESLGSREEQSPDQALRAWTSLVDLRPNEPEGHEKLAKHWQELGHWQSAAQQWQQVVRTREEDPRGWMALAQAQLKAGDRAAARSTAEEVLKRDWAKRFARVKKQAAKLLRKLDG